MMNIFLLEVLGNPIAEDIRQRDIQLINEFFSLLRSYTYRPPDDQVVWGCPLALHTFGILVGHIGWGGAHVGVIWGLWRTNLVAGNHSEGVVGPWFQVDLEFKGSLWGTTIISYVNSPYKNYILCICIPWTELPYTNRSLTLNWVLAAGTDSKAFSQVSGVKLVLYWMR